LIATANAGGLSGSALVACVCFLMGAIRNQAHRMPLIAE
jgi:hypothetical protein